MEKIDLRITEAHLKKIISEVLQENYGQIKFIRIADLERGPRKSIGRQGTTAEGIRNVLSFMFPGGELDLKRPVPEIFMQLRSDPALKAMAFEFVRRDPIEVDYLGDLDPDYPYEIRDGHHRATVLQQAGFTEIPAKIRNI